MGTNSCRGFARRHVDFWLDIILLGHPLRDTLMPYYAMAWASTTCCSRIPGSVD